MTDRPILFSAPMVRALLAGSKTQTRRVVKMKSHHQIEQRDDGSDWPWMYDGDHDSDWWMPCPYGQPGDRLWVRETFEDCSSALHSCVLYRADGGAPGTKWTPSIHMPRWASRITLEITGVRVERLQDITADDAMAEGIVRLPDGGYAADTDGRHYHGASAWYSYGSLWEAINGPGSWEANPWVWVIEFKGVAQ